MNDEGFQLVLEWEELGISLIILVLQGEQIDG
jgi:hypothetical protein